MGMKIIDLIQDSDEWKAWRSKGIGASNAAAVLNECKFKTTYELWLELTGRKPPFDGNMATERGKELEPAARAAYEVEHDFVEAPPICIEHPKHHLITASLDGYIFDSNIILEIKCPSEASHNLALSGEVPRHYWIQMQHQLMCAPESERAHYWSYFGKSGKRLTVEHDRPFQRELLKAELSFLKMVKNNIAPALCERDVKVVDDLETQKICDELLEIKLSGKSDAKTKERAEFLKGDVILLGGHNKIRCGQVLISKSISKTGKPSYRMNVSGAK